MAFTEQKKQRMKSLSDQMAKLSRSVTHTEVFSNKETLFATLDEIKRLNVEYYKLFDEQMHSALND